MRIAVGRLYHESNTFSSLLTTVGDFTSPASFGGMAVGEQVLQWTDRQDEITGFIDVLGEQSDIEIVPLINAGTVPSGLVTDDAVALLERTLRDQLNQVGKLDGVCWSTHGAISGQSIDDLDGYFLQVLRDAIGAQTPVVVALDCHAVVTELMLRHCTAVTAFRTHPHTDQVETGRRAARMLIDVLHGRTKPVVHSRRLPMLFTDSGTEQGPLKDIFDTMIAWDDKPGVIACSLCPAFPYQDVPGQGWTALAVTDDDDALAGHLARELAQIVWAARHELLPKSMLTPRQAIQKAVEVDGCPVIITDPADNTGGGAPGDTTTMLSTLIDHRHEVDGLILAHLPDELAIEQVADARVGDHVKVRIGAKRDTIFSSPLSIEGRIECVTQGAIADEGGFSGEPTIEIGRTLCISIDNVRIVLTQRPIMGPQPSLYRKVNLEPFDAKIVSVKSGIGYFVTYGHVAKAMIRADCPGAVSPNVRHFDFKRIKRPMFPLDLETSWQPN